MHGNILPALTGQAASLRDLAAAIREAHAAVVSALSGAVDHAIRCGNILAEAKKQTGHGRWGEFIRACDLGERQAQRYMQLAHLAEQKRPRGTDLAGMTIKGAIRHLAPPKSAEPSKPATAPKQVAEPELPTGTAGKRTIHVDIIEIWLAASPDDRTKAIESIGLKALLAAMPESWLPLIEKRLTERNTAPASAAADSAHQIPADLTIPAFMQRVRPLRDPHGAASSPLGVALDLIAEAVS